jgi:hypothetical protein
MVSREKMRELRFCIPKDISFYCVVVAGRIHASRFTAGNRSEQRGRGKLETQMSLGRSHQLEQR